MTTTTTALLSGEVCAKRHTDIFENLKLNLKIAVDGYPELHGADAESICRTSFTAQKKKDYALQDVFSAAAAVYCHELYFRSLCPFHTHPSLPKGKAAELLSKSFGSVGNFFYLVRTIAAGTTAPGFLWLCKKMSRRGPQLGLSRLPLYSVPDLRDTAPLLCIDLWEHAYIDKWGCDISGFADSYLRYTDWDLVFDFAAEKAP